MKTIITKSVRYCLTLIFATLLFSTIGYAQPALTSDTTDYSPGDTVFLSGSGFTAYETVTLRVIHADASPPDTGYAHLPWNITVDGSGNFVSTWVVDLDAIDELLTAKADGQTSLLHAEVNFTDATSGKIQSLSGACNNHNVVNDIIRWFLVPGASYSMDFSLNSSEWSTRQCSPNNITIYIGDISCFIATFYTSSGGFRYYTGSFTMPNPSCGSYPIRFRCGTDNTCNPSGAVLVLGVQGERQTHFVASTFGTNCNNPTTISCCNLAINAGADEQTYYGYALDQTVKRKVTATGGGGGYTYSWTLNRKLKCNIVNSVGDEAFFSTGSCLNNSCPAAPDTLSAAAPSCTNDSINVKLIEDGDVCVTVTDVNGCTATDCFHIDAIDARCFAGNSGNYKIYVCHHTSSNTNPWVQICIAQAAVPTHLAENNQDYIGVCGSRMSNAAYSNTMGMYVYPNPVQNLLNVEFDSPSTETYQVQMLDITGRVVFKGNGTALQGGNKIVLPVNGIARGVYNLRLTVGEVSSSVRLIVTE